MNFNYLRWPSSFQFTLRHPLKALCYFKSNMRAAYRRAKYGWCYSDAYNLYTWILKRVPQMLCVIEDDIAYPEINKFDTWKKWYEWLIQQAITNSIYYDNHS